MRAVVAVLGLLSVAALAMALVAPMMWPSRPSITGTQPTSSYMPTAEPSRMLIVAHRGDLDRFAENTAEAIWAAAELAVDGIEMDVHRSADGTWYVIHDATLDRTTDATGAIVELHDAEIDAAVIDGGHGFDPKARRGLRVPRLAAVLDGLREFHGRVYLDVKHAIGGDPAELLALAAGRPLAILCRDEAEAAAIEAQDDEVETILRWIPGAATTAADGWLMEAVREATAEAIDGVDRPVTTFVNERFVDRGEAEVVEGAWNAGITAFLTKHPSDALLNRDRLDHA